MAEKSKENSELQALLSEKTKSFELELQDLREMNDDLSAANASLEAELRDKFETIQKELKMELEVNFSLLIFAIRLLSKISFVCFFFSQKHQS